MKNNNNIVSFSNLVFYPMTAPNTGCIATGKLSSGYDITITGGNASQHANGVEEFLVEVSETNKAGDTKVYTKRNMHRDEISILLEHHYKNRFKKKRRRAA